MSTNILMRRLVSLYLGLVLFGGSVALMPRTRRYRSFRSRKLWFCNSAS